MPKRVFSIFQIESTSRCNIGKCLVCPRTSIHRENQDMEWETYKKISQYLPLVNSVYLSGWGEPLLHKRLVDMVKVAKEAGCYVGFTTNGTLLTYEISKKLVDLNLDLIEISLDGATPQTYEEIRKGAKFENVIDNISTLISLKHKVRKAKPKVMLSFLMMKKNINELPLIVDLAYEVGIEHILAKNVGLILKKVDEEQRLFSCNDRAVPKEVIEHIEKAKSKAKSYNIPLNVSPLELKPVPVCIALPVESCYFTWDGYVSPCDSLAHLDTPRIFCGKAEKSAPLMHFGNIQKEDLFKIWQKKEYREFRQSFRRRIRLSHSFSYKVVSTFMDILGKDKDFSDFFVKEAPIVCQSCHYLYGIY